MQVQVQMLLYSRSAACDRRLHLIPDSSALRAAPKPYVSSSQLQLALRFLHVLTMLFGQALSARLQNVPDLLLMVSCRSPADVAANKSCVVTGRFSRIWQRLTCHSRFPALLLMRRLIQLHPSLLISHDLFLGRPIHEYYSMIASPYWSYY